MWTLGTSHLVGKHGNFHLVGHTQRLIWGYQIFGGIINLVHLRDRKRQMRLSVGSNQHCWTHLPHMETPLGGGIILLSGNNRGYFFFSFCVGRSSARNSFKRHSLLDLFHEGKLRRTWNNISLIHFENVSWKTPPVRRSSSSSPISVIVYSPLRRFPLLVPVRNGPT